MTAAGGRLIRMGRIELELYADRLARHAERLRDDVEGSRMRIEWCGLESGPGASGARDSAVLDALGVFGAEDAAAERRLVERRLRQLRVVERFQALVEREIGREGLDDRSTKTRLWEPTSDARSRPSAADTRGINHLARVAVRCERGEQAAVLVVAGEEVDPHLLDDPGAVTDRQRLVHLADAPLEHHVDRVLPASNPDRPIASTRRLPSRSSSPKPVSSNTPLPAERIRASRSQAMKPALAGG